MFRRVVGEPWFALTELFLVLISGACWILRPEIGIWFTLLAFLPWVFRLLAGYFPFQRTPFDWLILLFLVTAWVGYWAAYDKTSAWIKAWFIVTAILLYYALNSQKKQNLAVLSLLSFCLGLGIAIHFLLTYDFAGIPSGIVGWWLGMRPQLGLPAIDHDYTCGLLVITGLFAAYWLQGLRERPRNTFNIAVWLFVILALGIMLVAFILTMSRGIWAAAACGLGAWVIWRLITWKRLGMETRLRPLFPILVLLYIGLIVVFIYLGPAQVGGASPRVTYGTNSRADVFTKGLYFLRDYPFTGAGLGSFPGTYSQYMLVIPNFYFINSYNLFLDVAIEQGWLGGLVFVLIYLGSIWQVGQTIAKSQSRQQQLISWLSLSAMIVTVVHGLFYDYFYNGIGTLLLFFPVGIAMCGVSNSESPGEKEERLPVAPASPTLNRAMVLIAILSMLVISFLNRNKIVSLWYSNLGAVQMSQVELKSFPTGEWITSALVPELVAADTSFRVALQYDPSNETANYRLGLISMLRQDFGLAVMNLENSYKELPGHRGIIKNLGYCYVWLGDLDKGAGMLKDISEAEHEMNVYSWWWDLQGRQDLAIHAFQVASRLAHEKTQP